jgi:hypothetical protein
LKRGASVELELLGINCLPVATGHPKQHPAPPPRHRAGRTLLKRI